MPSGQCDTGSLINYNSMAGWIGGNIPRPSGSAFSILGLSPVYWFDASDAGTLFQNSDGTTPAVNDDDPVGYWGDKSGNGRNLTQATALDRPLLKLAVQNGRNVLRFDGAGQFMNYTAATFTQAHWFAVASYSGATFAGFDSLLGNTNAASRVFVGINTGTAWLTNTAPSSVGAVYKQDGNAAVTAPTAWPAPVNGAWSAMSVLGASAPSFNIQVGRDSTDDTRCWTGDAAEIIAFGSALSDTNRDLILAYLKAKWGTP